MQKFESFFELEKRKRLGKLTVTVDEVREAKIIDRSTYVRLFQISGGVSVWFMIFLMLFLTVKLEYFREEFNMEGVF